ncbi:MAG: class I SAM-dependent methyltransferase [Chloroflexaceae bacterium]|nr:class I SAM-dependent methyltransferase [Chloroflexaceae bacterium]
MMGLLQRRYHWLFATLYDTLMAPAERQALAALRASLLRNVQGQVLEIGVGTGANLAFYAEGVRLIAVDPNPWMLVQAQQRAFTVPAVVVPVQGHAEGLPVADGACQAVVSTFVLCSVRDLHQAIAELWRVIQPGGQALLLEHIRSDNPYWYALQRAWNPFQRVFGDGCCLTRDTLDVLQAQGFVLQHVQPLAGGPFPLRMVQAIRPA